MKRKICTLFLTGALLSAPAQAGPKQFLRAYARQVRLTFADVKRHPFAWGIYFGGTVLLNYADTASTCYGLAHRDLVEGNPLFGRRPRCSTLAITTTAVTFGAQLPAVHALSDKWTEHCRVEAADPSSRWNQLANKGYGSRNPESCRWNIPAAAAAEWPVHTVIVRDNIQLIEKR